MVAKDYKPKWTVWNWKTVRKDVISHKRRHRRRMKHALRTGRIEDFNRASRMLTRRDFD